MFRRYPYWGWLLLSLVLWCINGFNFHMHRQALLPERMASAVNTDLRQREEAFDDFAKQHDLIGKIFTNTLSEKESDRITSLPFYVYGYSGDTLIFWNKNTIVSPLINDSARYQPVVLYIERGLFIERSIVFPAADGDKTLMVLLPVLITYPVENDYLKSHFVASPDIPPGTKIIAAADSVQQAYPVTMRNNTKVFSLQFNQQDIQKWTPNALFIILLIAAILATVSWIQLMIISLTRRSTAAGVWVTLIVIVGIRWLLYAYGAPFNLDTLTFFSPLLYASSTYLPSFGHLFITTLCLLWFVIFITRHTNYRSYFDKVRSGGLRYAIAVVLIVALIAYAYLFVTIVRSLVLDSRISFDVSRFYAIDIYTILGLLAIGIITGMSCLVVYLFNVQLNALEQHKWTKYLLIAITGIICVFMAKGQGDIFHWILLAWLFLFIVLLDIPKLSLVSDLFEPHMIFWAVFICFFCTGILHYFNNLKERETRITYVMQLTPQRDMPVEYAFDKVADSIAQDKAVKSFFYKPGAPARKLLNQILSSQYLSGSALSKYEPKIYLYNADGIGLFNNDSTDFFTLLDEKNEASPSSSSPNLFYKESILDRNYYLSYIKVYNDTINSVIGYVMIDLALKKQANETVNSELLQPAFNKDKANEYAYAIYVNSKLISQVNVNDYSFTTYLRNDTLSEQSYEFYDNNNSELHYRVGDKRTIVVVHNHSLAIELITLFSYLFGMQILLAIVILVYQLYLSYFTSALISGKFIKFTLRRRIHLSMLSVVLLSFIIIGVVTIWFFTYQYRVSNQGKLRSLMQATKQSAQDYLKREGAYGTDNSFDSVSKSAAFRNFISNIANGQKIDINVFDDKGMLFNTSEEDIYNKGLVSNRMRRDAYYQLNNLGKSIVIQDEKIAALAYLSAYEPLRDERGVTLGYLNIPLFSSERDLNFQISNIVVTLINLYAFIFLISSVITVFITQWITRIFTIIIKQFEQLNLQQNERITWPYEDEIGRLVTEYNKMVNKVEENAARLAQSERESAWREMARQVAHEIKNPLTPMKLNIQYLQQALRNDSPNVKELADKVSTSIIEQIDNLSYIASEFSNFAKMPEARPEELELGNLLNSALELYLNDNNIRLTVNKSPENLYVFSDRSQLLRVFTNLLENAKQALSVNEAGQIEVSVKADNGDAIIMIKDNGEGIPEDVVKKIFQPYFTTKTSGTGLGLAMTRKIIEFWKGEIWFETEEGVGTSFYIRLPLLRKSGQ